jgi:hypothetical protein
VAHRKTLDLVAGQPYFIQMKDGGLGINNLDNDADKLNIYKSGYCRGSGRIPKIDLKSGRTQEVYNTYCFKIFASESSLDNSKAKGLRDRSFEILCLVGKP